MFNRVKLLFAKKLVNSTVDFTLAKTCIGCKFPLKCVEVGDCFRNMEKEHLKRVAAKKVTRNERS